MIEQCEILNCRSRIGAPGEGDLFRVGQWGRVSPSGGGHCRWEGVAVDWIWHSAETHHRQEQPASAEGNHKHHHGLASQSNFFYMCIDLLGI